MLAALPVRSRERRRAERGVARSAGAIARVLRAAPAGGQHREELVDAGLGGGQPVRGRLPPGAGGGRPGPRGRPLTAPPRDPLPGIWFTRRGLSRLAAGRGRPSRRPALPRSTGSAGGRPTGLARARNAP